MSQSPRDRGLVGLFAIGAISRAPLWTELLAWPSCGMVKQLGPPIGGDLQITDQYGCGAIRAADAKPLGRVFNDLSFHVIRPAERLRQRLQSQFEVDKAQMLILNLGGHGIIHLWVDHARKCPSLAKGSARLRAARRSHL